MSRLPPCAARAPHDPQRQRRADHRRHRAGRRLPRRASAGEGLHGARRQAPGVFLQHRARRPPVPGPARARAAFHPALRGPHRRDEPHPRGAGGAAGRDLQPRGAEPRGGVVRDPGVHGQRRCARHAAPARGHPHPGAAGQDPLLPGLHERDVRQGARGPPERDHAVLPPESLRRGQGVRLLDHRELPRGVRHARLERDPLQPRGPDPRRDLRHPQDHARGGPREARAAGAALPREPGRAARLGPRARLRAGPVAHPAAGRAGRLRDRHGAPVGGAGLRRRGVRRDWRQARVAG